MNEQQADERQADEQQADEQQADERQANERQADEQQADERRAIIALGANLGNKDQVLLEAAESIAKSTGIRVVQMSSIYHSEAAYVTDQDDFANAVLWAEVQNSLSPLQLLHRLQAIEKAFGRERHAEYGPRTLDLDIIDFEGVVSTEQELILPHPLALERDFVVTPLLEILPHCILADGTEVTRTYAHIGKVIQS